MAIDPNQEFLVQPVDASWLQCNIECQEACPVGTNCRGYLNLAAEGRFEEGYILSREPNPVAAMCAYVCSAPCERACRRGDIDRPLAIRAMKRFLVEWHEASGIPDVMPHIEARPEKVAVVGAGPAPTTATVVSRGVIWGMSSGMPLAWCHSTRKRFMARMASGRSISPRRQARSHGAEHTYAHMAATGLGSRERM